jgi:hypothetical protein
LLFTLTGCLRRQGRNDDCQWPGGSQSLRDDVEFAEELSIRYMDAHFGPKNPVAAAEAKNRCLGSLLGEVGKGHGVTAQAAFQLFGRRDPVADAAILGAFTLLYALGAAFALSRLGDRPLLLLLLLSLAFGAAGVVLAEPWSLLAEILRTGNSHMSNRALRLPAVQHRAAVFVASASVYLAVLALVLRKRSVVS